MKTYLLVIFLFSMLFANAQQQSFSKVYYNGADYIQAYDLLRASDNTYYIAGYGFLTKTDSAGNIIWTKQYYTGTTTKFNSIIPDGETSLVLSGISNDGDALILKVDLNGDTLWSKFIDFGFYSESCTVSPVHDSGFVICGTVYYSAAPTKMFVARVSIDGSLMWSKTYSMAGHANYAYSVKETPDSGFIVAGFAEKFPPIETFATLLKLDSNGDVEWCRGLSEASSDANFARDVLITQNGFLFGCDFANYFTLVSTDLAGNVQWAKNQLVFGDNYLNSNPTRLKEIRNSRLMFIVASEMGYFGNLIVCDSTGNQLSNNSIYMYGSSAVEAADSGFMVLGKGPLLGVKSDLKNIIESQFVLVKTDSSGNSVMCNDPLSAGSVSTTLVTDTLMVTSVAAGTAHDLSFMVNNLILMVANECVGFTGGLEDEDRYSFSVYPNPSNGAFSLRFDESLNNKTCVIELYNMLGVCVYRVSEKIGKEIAVSINCPQSGLYFVKVIGDDFGYSKAIEFVNE